MRYLFIAGCGHSGTSLLLSYFAATNRVLALTEETHFLLRGSISDFKRKYTPPACNEFDLLVEKTPRHVYALDKIYSSPDCSALITIRNPVDTVASLMKRGASIDQAILRYHNDNGTWINKTKELPLALLKYEELVTNERGVINWLGSMYDLDLSATISGRLNSTKLFFGATEASTSDGKHGENHLKLRNHQMRQPVNNQNGQWRERLNQSQLNLIKTKLAPLMSYLGYEECLDYKIEEEYHVIPVHD